VDRHAQLLTERGWDDWRTVGETKVVLVDPVRDLLTLVAWPYRAELLDPYPQWRVVLDIGNGELRRVIVGKQLWTVVGWQSPAELAVLDAVPWVDWVPEWGRLEPGSWHRWCRRARVVAVEPGVWAGVMWPIPEGNGVVVGGVVFNG